MTESFNLWIGELRKKPLLTTLSEIVIKLGKRRVKREIQCAGWNESITPAARKKANTNIELFRLCHCFSMGNSKVSN